MSVIRLAAEAARPSSGSPGDAGARHPPSPAEGNAPSCVRMGLSRTPVGALSSTHDTARARGPLLPRERKHLPAPRRGRRRHGALAVPRSSCRADADRRAERGGVHPPARPRGSRMECAGHPSSRRRGGSDRQAAAVDPRARGGRGTSRCRNPRRTRDLRQRGDTARTVGYPQARPSAPGTFPALVLARCRMPMASERIDCTARTNPRRLSRRHPVQRRALPSPRRRSCHVGVRDPPGTVLAGPSCPSRVENGCRAAPGPRVQRPFRLGARNDRDHPSGTGRDPGSPAGAPARTPRRRTGGAATRAPVRWMGVSSRRSAAPCGSCA